VDTKLLTSIESTNVLSPLNRELGKVSPEAERAQVEMLAQQFESLLLAQMMREMKASMAPESDDEGQGFGGAIMGDTFISELGLALSRSGGVGLSQVLIDGFTKQMPTLAVSPEAKAAIEAAAAKSDVETPAPILKPLATGVSSEFGWRTDPIDGRQRFHAGTDLRLAYGQEVRAAAPGSVAFAGDQGGYGNTLVVRHADGLETRYAHLSSLDVRVGDEVAAGQVIARSGNSGRTTGPHLHFEVRHNGRPVNPEAIEGLASLDELGGDLGH
jgi:murein DD-endopeptidase MepM/ murein hydrolase activator NlpD